jgi:hypothetical protein
MIHEEFIRKNAYCAREKRANTSCLDLIRAIRLIRGCSHSASPALSEAKCFTPLQSCKIIAACEDSLSVPRIHANKREWKNLKRSL